MQGQFCLFNQGKECQTNVINPNRFYPFSPTFFPLPPGYHSCRRADYWNMGWLTAGFHVESEDLARMFVLGFGAQATILEPLELREAVLQLAADIQQHYRLSVVCPPQVIPPSGT